MRQELKVLQRDAAALSDHAAFLNNKISFLLDATLGLINLEQNQIIKIFSVAAVVFLPPTLVASIYGMNFHLMPELHLAVRLPDGARADDRSRPSCPTCSSSEKAGSEACPRNSLAS